MKFWTVWKRRRKYPEVLRHIAQMEAELNIGQPLYPPKLRKIHPDGSWDFEQGGLVFKGFRPNVAATSATSASRLVSFNEFAPGAVLHFPVGSPPTIIAREEA